jgi:hypothetical protein
MYDIGWSNDTMAFDHHLMFYMNTHVNIMQAMAIFNVILGVILMTNYSHDW